MLQIKISRQLAKVLLCTFVLTAVQFQLVYAQSKCITSPEPIELKQPDGSTLKVYGKGNRELSYTRTSDGYTLLSSSKGQYEYAQRNEEGELELSGVIAHDKLNRSSKELKFLTSIVPNLTYGMAQTAQLKAKFEEKEPAAVLAANSHAFPTSGVRKVLMLMIQYPDLTQTHSVGEFDNFMNQVGYTGSGSGTGSFKDYFEEVSFGQLTLNTDVFGWYTAANPFTYYADSSSNPDAQRELVAEAIDAAEAAGVDFAQYDNDGDGSVDGIIIVHAGPGAEIGSQTQYIWSHRSSIYGATARTYDGVDIRDYMINPERREPNMAKIGVFCHEFGHGLGLPDLYDTDDMVTGDSEGIGNWGAMGSCIYLNSENTPCHLGAWSKQKLGWQTPSVISAANTYSLNPAATNNFSYKVLTPDLSEYFLLENRQKVGFDAYLPGEGLAIWHIDTDKADLYPGNNSVNADETNKGIDLEEADGNDDLDNENNRGDAGDLFPGSSNITSFGNATGPGSQTYAGGNSGIEVTAISENTNIVQFNLNCVDPPLPVDIVGSNSAILSSFGNPYSVGAIGGVTSYTWTVPAGATIVSQGNNTIMVDFGTTSGNVCVSTTNACGMNSGTYCEMVSLGVASPYCVPNPTNGTDFGDYIEGVELGTIVNNNNSVTSDTNYVDYTSMSTTLIQGVGDTLYIEAGAYFDDDFAVWIDYNQDGDFSDAGEKIDSINTNVANEIIKMEIVVPLTAMLGTTTMRIRSVWNSAPLDPCTDYVYGETEDYTINIVAPNVPVVDFSASATSVGIGSTIDFTDLTTNTPTNWTWTFEGGTPTSSNVQNPSITYNAAGSYFVKLVASNADGTDSLTKSTFINVAGYCASTATSTLDTEIDSVVFSNLTRTSVTNCTVYTDYLTDTAKVFRGLTYPLTVRTGDCNGNTSFDRGTEVYIDWNGDFDFADVGESGILSVPNGPESTVTVNVTIPPTAILGTTRMRIVSTEGGVAGPCGSYQYGETEEYSINISVEPPTAEFSGVPLSINMGQSVAFTDLSTKTPTGWEWSFTGGTPAVSSAQNPNILYSSPGVYAVQLIASNAGGPDTNLKVAYVTVLDTNTTYCIPNPTNGTDDGDFILSVSMGTISNLNNSIQGDTNYHNYVGMSTDLLKGSSQTVTVVSGDWATDVIAVWIDYNQDGDFLDADEKLGEFSTTAANETVLFPFNVSATAIVGTTRMRVRAVWNQTNMSPCTDYAYGETEDYSVNIQPSLDPAPVADFAGVPLSISTGSTVSFSDLSTNTPTAWAWTFTGGVTPSSTVQNPVITYNLPGVYPVTLIAYNAGGSDTITKVSYITVTGYCVSSGSSTLDSEIDSVVFAGINRISTNNCVGYTNYMATDTAHVLLGNSYPISVRTGDCEDANLFDRAMEVYIDWNGDSDFDDVGESGLLSEANGPMTTTNGNIMVPFSATLGATRMRIVCTEGGVNGPCESYAYGETEEYIVNITSPCPIPTFGVTYVNPSSCGGNEGVIFISGLNVSDSYTIQYDSAGITQPALVLTSSPIGLISLPGKSADTYSNISVSLNSCFTYGVSPTPIVMTDPAPPTFSVGATSPTTCSGTDGNLRLTGLTASSTYAVWIDINGSTAGPLNYTTDGSGIINIGSLSAATYSNVTVEINGCTGADAGMYVLSDPASPAYTVSSSNPTSCGTNTGTIQLNGLTSGTIYSVSYDRNGVAVGPVNLTANILGVATIASLDAANYDNIIVTLSNCATADPGSYMLTDPASPTFSIVANSTSVCGANDGSLMFTGLLTNTVYSVEFDSSGVNIGPNNMTSNGAGEITIANLLAGAYTNVSASINGCTTVDAATHNVMDPGAPVFLVGSSDPTTCGGSDGNLRLTGLSNLTTYSISYFNGVSTVGPANFNSDGFGAIDISGLSAATYSDVSVSVNGCTTLDTNSNVISDPFAPTFTVSLVSPTVCGAADGSLRITGLLASTSYQISYFDGSSTIGPSNFNSDFSGEIIISGLASGNYTQLSITESGCSAIDAGPYALVDPPLTAFSVVASNTSICGGSDGSLTLNGLATFTTYNVSYLLGGSAVGPLSIASDGSGQLVISSLTTGPYMDINVADGGCSALDTNIYNINDPSGPVFAVNSVDPSMCNTADGSINLTGLSTSSPYDVSYVSDSGPVGPLSLNSDGAGIIQISGLADGAYSGIQVEDASGCASSDPGNYMLNDPGAPVFMVAVSNPGSCGATDGSLMLSGLDISTMYVVSYIQGGTNVGPLMLGSDGSGIIVIGSLGANSYTSISVMEGTCETIDTSNYILSDPGAPTFGLLSSNPTTCGGSDGSITIIGLSSSIAYMVDYSINGTPSGFTSATADGSGNILLSGLNAGSYSSISVDLAGCTAISTMDIDLTDPVATQPSLLLVGDSVLCPGATASLAVTIAGTYQWYKDATLINGATSLSYSVNDSGNYYVEVTLTNNCVVNSEISQINLFNVIDPVISGLQSTYCSNDAAAILTTNVSGGVFSGTGISGSSFDPTMANVGLNVVIYDVTDANGCDLSDTVNTVVQTAGTPNVSYTESINNLSVVFAGASTSGISSWDWTFGDGNSSTQQNPTYTYSLPGTYEVCLNVTNACGVSNSICDSVTVGNVGVLSLGDFKLDLYPNPSSGIVFLKAELKQGDQLEMNLYSSVGTLVYQKNYGKITQQINEPLDFSSLPNGVYSVQYILNQDVFFKQLILTK